MTSVIIGTEETLLVALKLSVPGGPKYGGAPSPSSSVWFNRPVLVLFPAGGFNVVVKDGILEEGTTVVVVVASGDSFSLVFGICSVLNSFVVAAGDVGST